MVTIFFISIDIINGIKKKMMSNNQAEAFIRGDLNDAALPVLSPYPQKLLMHD